MRAGLGLIGRTGVRTGSPKETARQLGTRSARPQPGQQTQPKPLRCRRAISAISANPTPRHDEYARFALIALIALAGAARLSPLAGHSLGLLDPAGDVALGPNRR